MTSLNPSIANAPARSADALLDFFSPSFTFGSVGTNLSPAPFVWEMEFYGFVNCKLNERFGLSFDQSFFRIVDLSFVRSIFMLLFLILL